MPVIHSSLRRQIATAAAVATASIAAACSDTTGPSSPARVTPAPSAWLALAVGANTIVFQRDSGGVSGIYTMNDDGTNLMRLGSGERPAWSPDHAKIVFELNNTVAIMTGRLDKGQCIGIVNADGTGFRTFTNDVAFCSAVSWSPDGKGLAFTSITAGTAGIYRAPVDEAGTPTRLTTPAAAALDVKLSWAR